jgi:tRNA (cmo5U34)-methyltransferase
MAFHRSQSVSADDIAVERLKQRGLIERTKVRLGYVDDLPLERRFDVATLICVLHHLQGGNTKRAILRSLAARLKPGAPLILACNRHAYADQPPLLAARG